MKKTAYLIVLLFLSGFVFAQNAEQILDKVSSHYKDQNSVYIKFKSNLENKEAKTSDQFSGEVYVKGNKYNLTINKLNIQQIYDGSKLYTISLDNKEVTVTKPEKGSEELFTPTSVLDVYKDGYQISLDKKSNGIQYIKLVPTDASDLSSILIGVDEATNSLKKIIQKNKNNTTTTLTVEKQVDDIIIPKSLLRFNKKFYKDYYISEL